jgi:hypothetical protein
MADEMYAADARLMKRASWFQPRRYHGALGMHVGEPAHGGERYVPGAVGILIGVWLLFTPLAAEPAVTHARVLGVIVCAVAALSLAEVARPARWLNVALGLFVLATPILFGYGVRGAMHAVMIGILLAMGSSLGGESRAAEQPSVPS